MATASRPLTLDEFHARYRGQKPHFEYWFGEAIQKAVPTTLHGLLQGILVALLRKAGYKAGTEIELRIDSNWEPVPDVIAAEHLERSYPTQLVPVVECGCRAAGDDTKACAAERAAIQLADAWRELEEQL
jgi:Uma2 family endonuclease